MTVITVLAGTAFGLFVALFSLPHASAQTADEINNLEHFWAYGRSPPVYPSPIATGLGEWADAFTQAYALVTQMTNEEKMNVTIGYYGAPNGCSGNSGGVPRLDYPGLCLNDAGNGLRGTDGTTGYPSALHVGAAWNRNLAYNRGQYMGAEFRRKGASMALGPVVGPLVSYCTASSIPYSQSKGPRCGRWQKLGRYG
jgi:beta-glucosidase